MIVFDLDGTLVDTADDIARAANAVLARHGFAPHSAEAYRRMVGEGARVLFARALPPEARDQADALAAEFRELYARNLIVDSHPFDGIVPMLERLADAGLTLAVLSNKPHEHTVRIVKELLGDVPFAVVRGYAPPVPLKPAPEPFLEVARAAGVDPDSCTVVGDTPADVTGALAAGMTPVAVAWGFRPPELLVRCGATFLARSPDALLDHLLAAAPHGEIARDAP